MQSGGRGAFSLQHCRYGATGRTETLVGAAERSLVRPNKYRSLETHDPCRERFYSPATRPTVRVGGDRQTCAHKAGAEEWACLGQHGELPQTEPDLVPDETFSGAGETASQSHP